MEFIFPSTFSVGVFTNKHITLQEIFASHMLFNVLSSHHLARIANCRSGIGQQIMHATCIGHELELFELIASQESLVFVGRTKCQGMTFSWFKMLGDYGHLGETCRMNLHKDGLPAIYSSLIASLLDFLIVQASSNSTCFTRNFGTTWQNLTAMGVQVYKFNYKLRIFAE